MTPNDITSQVIVLVSSHLCTFKTFPYVMLLVPEGIICIGVNASALKWFIFVYCVYFTKFTVPK